MKSNHFNFWAIYKNFVQTVVLHHTNQDLKKVYYWRNETFCSILTYITPLSIIALIPGIFMAFIGKVAVVGVVDLFTFFCMVIITLSPGIKLELRKSIFIFILYCLSFTLLYYLPLPGAGLLFLLTITVFTSLIYSSAAAYYSAWANTLICVCFALLIYFKINIPISTSYSFGAWIAISSNLILLSFAFTKCSDVLLVGIENSINENKITELKLEKTTRLYQFISQINQSIVHTKDEETLFEKCCHIAFATGKFKMVWIGKFDYDYKKILLSHQNGIPYSSIPLFSASYQNNGPQDYVLRSDSYYVCNDIESDLELDNWKPFAALNGIKSCIILPIRKEGVIIGSFNIYAEEINFFDAAEIALLQEATGDISFALDIFEKEKRHKLAEEIIIENENRFRSLIEKSNDIKTLTDINGDFIYGSPSITKLFGYSIEEFLHKSAFTFFHPEDLPHLIRKRTTIIQVPGASFSFQYRLLHKNGTWIWCEGTLTNMLHEPGINAFVSNFRDISERKQAEERHIIISNNLQIALTNLQKFMDLSLDIICSIDEEGKFVNVSKAVENIFGYHASELVGKKYINMVLSEDVEKTNKAAEKAIDGDPINFFENRCRHKNGTIVNILWSARWDDDSKLIYCIAKDITDITNKGEQIKKSELFNRSLINSITAHIAVVDQQGTIMAVNNAWNEFGSKNGVTALGRVGKGANYFDACEKAAMAGDDIAGQVLQGMKDILNEKQNVFYLEYPCHSPKEKRWFAIRVMKFEGKERLIITLHTDITDRKKEEKEREKITRDLVQRNNNLEQFSYIVSHNLRAPVVNILGFAELMKYENSNQRIIMDSMKGMATAAKNLDDVIKDMNEILQTTTIVSENIEEVHFQRLVEDISLSINNSIKKENVVIITDFRSIEKMLSVKTYLYSIFYNLIINSIKFRKPYASPIIEIKSERTSNGILLIFKDNGIGIDLEKNKESLFGLYKRFHLHIEGKGMGMFMTKTHIETLGGKISISSEVNKGTELTVEFKNND